MYPPITSVETLHVTSLRGVEFAQIIFNRTVLHYEFLAVPKDF